MSRQTFVSFRVHPGEKADMNLVARIRGVSRSQLLRKLVREEKERVANREDGDERRDPGQGEAA